MVVATAAYFGDQLSFRTLVNLHDYLTSGTLGRPRQLAHQLAVFEAASCVPIIRSPAFKGLRAQAAVKRAHMRHTRVAVLR